MRSPEDRLPALVQEIDFEYIARLWKFELIAQLAWYRIFSSQGKRPSVYLAPSWSWVSVDGHVDMNLCITRFSKNSSSWSGAEAELIACSVVPLSFISCEIRNTRNPSKSPLGCGISRQIPQLHSDVRLFIWIVWRWETFFCSTPDLHARCNATV